VADHERELPPPETVALWLAQIPKMSPGILDSFVQRLERFGKFPADLESAVAARSRELKQGRDA